MDDHPLRKWRDEKKVTLDDLAKQLEVSPSFLSMLERGDRGVSMELAGKIVSATGGDVPLEAFLSRSAA